MVEYQKTMLSTGDYETVLLNLEEVTNYHVKMNQNFSNFENYVKAINN